MTQPEDLPLHPWNREFTWSVSAPPYRCLTEEQVEQFDRDGFIVVPDVFGRETLAPLVDEIDRFEAEVEQFLSDLDGERFSIAEAGAITFATHLVSRSPRLRAFACDPFFIGTCADLIGPDVNLYWDQAVYKKPEKPRRFPWHQDNGYAFVEPQQYLTLGWECLQDPDPSDVVVAPVAAGGVVLFSSLTPHLTGPNLTDQVRKAYILQYAPAGATVLSGNAPGEPTDANPADDPNRQFPVLRSGGPVSA